MAVKYYSLCKLSSQAVMQSTFCLFPPTRLHQWRHEREEEMMIDGTFCRWHLVFASFKAFRKHILSDGKDTRQERVGWSGSELRWVLASSNAHLKLIAVRLEGNFEFYWKINWGKLEIFHGKPSENSCGKLKSYIKFDEPLSPDVTFKKLKAINETRIIHGNKSGGGSSRYLIKRCNLSNCYMWATSFCFHSSAFFHSLGIYLLFLFSLTLSLGGCLDCLQTQQRLDWSNTCNTNFSSKYFHILRYFCSTFVEGMKKRPFLEIATITFLKHFLSVFKSVYVLKRARQHLEAESVCN